MRALNGSRNRFTLEVAGSVDGCEQGHHLCRGHSSGLCGWEGISESADAPSTLLELYSFSKRLAVAFPPFPGVSSAYSCEWSSGQVAVPELGQVLMLTLGSQASDPSPRLEKIRDHAARLPHGGEFGSSTLGGRALCEPCVGKS